MKIFSLIILERIINEKFNRELKEIIKEDLNCFKDIYKEAIYKTLIKILVKRYNI